MQYSLCNFGTTLRNVKELKATSVPNQGANFKPFCKHKKYRSCLALTICKSVVFVVED